ncbi:MAG: GNAT family N-acetyltransferase [Aggregatilineales bacterium]
MNDLNLREVRTMSEFDTLVKLQQAIWGMPVESVTSSYVMMATIHTGGVVIGAERNGELVGFCFAFVAWRGDRPFLWSHMAGVLPEYRGQGIGSMLKHAQRKWALEHDYSIISWTFDPIQYGNANFNFRHLGCVADSYLVNHYGEMTDEINAGLASDRLEVRWQLHDARVIASAEAGLPDNIITPNDDGTFILQADEAYEPLRATETAFEQVTCFAEVPYNINTLKRDDIEKAKRWQIGLRWALQEAFQRGFFITNFAGKENRGWYVLTRTYTEPTSKFRRET